MTSPLLRFATAAVRVWTRAYTLRTQPALRDERRAEIESDLWELQHDPEGGRGLTPPVQVIARLLIGVPDDLCWRMEHAVARDTRRLRRTIALTAAALALVALWILPARLRRDVPADRARVLDCGTASAPPQTRAEFRMQVINCAGAFFTSRRSTDSGPAGRDD
jgi:hypothetical protein